jgi:hypothetical protein
MDCAAIEAERRGKEDAEDMDDRLRGMFGARAPEDDRLPYRLGMEQSLKRAARQNDVLWNSPPQDLLTPHYAAIDAERRRKEDAEAADKRSKEDAERRKEDAEEARCVEILQVLPKPELMLIKLPPWCKKIKDLDDVRELMFKTGSRNRTFLFVRKPVRLVVEVFCNPQEQHGDYSIENGYASRITGYDTFGPLTVVCTCNGILVSMQTFLKLCMENGKPLRKYTDQEKNFPGIYGDMLQRLVLGSEREASRELEAAGSKRKAPEHPPSRQVRTRSSNGAAGADVGAGTLSLLPAAGADVRRSDRKRKPTVIYDPSVVKTEGGDQP